MSTVTPRCQNVISNPSVRQRSFLFVPAFLLMSIVGCSQTITVNASNFSGGNGILNVHITTTNVDHVYGSVTGVANAQAAIKVVQLVQPPIDPVPQVKIVAVLSNNMGELARNEQLVNTPGAQSNSVTVQAKSGNVIEITTP